MIYYELTQHIHKVAIANPHEISDMNPTLGDTLTSSKEPTNRTRNPFLDPERRKHPFQRPTPTTPRPPSARTDSFSCVSTPLHPPSPQGQQRRLPARQHYCRSIYSSPPLAAPSAWNTNARPTSRDMPSCGWRHQVGRRLSTLPTGSTISNVARGGRICGR